MKIIRLSITFAQVSTRSLNFGRTFTINYKKQLSHQDNLCADKSFFQETLSTFWGPKGKIHPTQIVQSTNTYYISMQ